MSEIMTDEEINKIYSEVECSGRMQYGGHMLPLIHHGLAANARICELEKEIAKLKEREAAADDTIADLEQKVRDFDLVKTLNKRCCKKIESLEKESAELKQNASRYTVAELRREIAVLTRAIEYIALILFLDSDKAKVCIEEEKAKARAELEAADGSEKAE